MTEAVKKARVKVTRAATDIHPKVKVPAVVGTIIAAVLAVLAILTTVPATAAYAAIGMTIVSTLVGYTTTGDAPAGG
jgi:hypothetical protein